MYLHSRRAVRFSLLSLHTTRCYSTQIQTQTKAKTKTSQKPSSNHTNSSTSHSKLPPSQHKSIFSFPQPQQQQQSQQDYAIPQSTNQEQPKQTHTTHIPVIISQAEPTTYVPPLDKTQTGIGRKTPKNVEGKTCADIVAYFERQHAAGIANYPLRFARAILRTGMTDAHVDTLFTIARNTASATVEVFNSIMIHYFEQPDQVVKYFELLVSDGRQPDSTSYDCLIKAYTKKGLERKVKEAIGQMHAQGVPMLEKTFAKTLQYFSFLRQPTFVLDLYTAQAQSSPFTDPRTYANVITALVSSGYTDEAWALAQKGAKQQLVPFISTWVILMSEMKRKNTDTALSIFAFMQENNIKPDMAIYLILIEIYALKSMPDKMLEMYDALSSEGFPITEELITKFFEGLARTSPSHAVRFLKEIQKHVNLPKQESFNILMEQIESNDAKSMKAVVAAAEQVHGSAYSARISDKLVRAHLANNNWQQALQVLDSMVNYGIKPKAQLVSRIVANMTAAGKSSQARQVVESLIKKGVTGIETQLNKLPAREGRPVIIST